MKLVKYVGEYEIIPAGYRIAWRSYSRMKGVCFPIGIHLIAMLLHRLWILTYRWPRPDWLERRDCEMMAKGRELEREYQERLGRYCGDNGTAKENFKKGYDAGWDAHRIYRDLRDKVESLRKEKERADHVPAVGKDGLAERGIQPERTGVEQAGPDAEGDR